MSTELTVRQELESRFDPIEGAIQLDDGKTLLLPFYQIYRVIDESINSHFDLKYDNDSGLWFLKVYTLD